MVSTSLELTAPTLRDRIRQGFQALRPTSTPAHDAILTAILTPEQRTAFLRLSRFDQTHLCRVYEVLREQGEDDPDVLVAALLHDLGKASSEGNVRLLHRVARVLLARSVPSILNRLARPPASRWRTGFVLAVHHAQLGAELAERLGCSPRTCWLIAHHEDNPLPDDLQLRHLVAADHAA
jgi:hypothetical protein